jgi:hypothetical protein
LAATEAPAWSSRIVARKARRISRHGRRNTTPPTARSLARVEHVFARLKGRKILHDCRLKGDGVDHAVLGIGRLYNLALAG